MQKDATELRWILSVIRRWLWLIVSCVLLGTIGAFLITSQMPPVYSASVTLLVRVDAETSMSEYTALLASEQLALTYSQMLKGRPVLEAVIAQLEMQTTPEILAEKVNVTPVKDTSLIRLTVQHADPTQAALIANTIADVFIAQIRAPRRSGINVTVAEPAWVPESPIRSRTLYTSLAAVVSMMLGAGAAFLLEYLDDTIKVPEDVKLVLGLNTVGVIGRLAKGKGELVMTAQPRSPLAEAFRGLCTNIRFSSADKPLKTLLVTSPDVAEGKSIIVANLSAAMAQAGLRVIAVDADLRRPRLHQLFSLDLNGQASANGMSRGLTEALPEGRTDGNLQPTQVDGLSVLPSGGLPPNPAELAGSDHMRELLHTLAQQADVVLLDSPPLLAVADAIALAQAVDGVLLVVVAGRTQRQTARQAVEGLRQVGANLVGVVLNAVPTRKGSYDRYREYYRDRDESGEHRPRRKNGPRTAVQRLFQRRSKAA
jgi:succinoglycan biosynthesis transport protein ExoP